MNQVEITNLIEQNQLNKGRRKLFYFQKKLEIN